MQIFDTVPEMDPDGMHPHSINVPGGATALVYPLKNHMRVAIVSQI